MPRNLRPRKPKLSYAAIAGEDSEDENSDSIAQKSKRSSVDEDASSGSSFAPEKATDHRVADADDNIAVAVPEEPQDDHLSAPISRRTSSTVHPKQKAGSNEGSSKTSLTRAPKRQMYVLPTPSVHHRHRAVPLYTHGGRVERLENRPSLFKTPKLTMSNNFTQNSKVTDRVNKAWGYNVGSGPLWEMVEDRGWYKEAVKNIPNMDSDSNRRPKVYQNSRVQSGYVVLSATDAASYLPTDVVTTDEGNLKPPPPVTCLFGPLDHQIEMKVEMFQSLNMSELLPEKVAHVFNAGAPVWGLDWCPIHSDSRAAHSFKQYLAVAPFPTGSHSPEIGVRVARPSPACIQIWSFGPAPISLGLDTSQGEVKCEMVLCLEGGPAHEIKWCPLPAHDDDASIIARPRKLGLLGGSFEDGSWALYVVPYPQDIQPPGHDSSQPVYVRLPEPLLRIELEEANFWTFDWANSEVIAIGTTNGIIAVYDLGSYLKSEDPVSNDILPTHYITVHQSAIRALAWIRAPPTTTTGATCTNDDPTVIASGGYDGMECMTDIREGHGSIMNRTRDVINAMTFSSFGGGPITIDHENIVKAYSTSPSMLGRGHTLLDPKGPVWSVNASDFHPQLAVGSADGSCTTTNSLKSTRRGGSVPFFVHKIYQLDYSRQLSSFRMLDRFLPQEIQDRSGTRKPPKGTGGTQEDTRKATSAGTGAWPRQVGVHRVVWNSCNGLAASALLASATASGLCRIDELWGRWIKGKIPYGSIERIRQEFDDDNAMDLDRESDDSTSG